MEHNPIACELCRIKKCKCDRKLPACSQCVTSESTCQYPQSNKRGIPPGFISGLERRLLETEAALFEALSFINTHLHQSNLAEADSPHHDAFIRQNVAQPRDAKVEEWKRLPLASADQRQAWMREKFHRAGEEDRRNSVTEFAPQEVETQWTQSSLAEHFVRRNDQSTSPDEAFNQDTRIENMRLPDNYQMNVNNGSIVQSVSHASRIGLNMADTFADPKGWAGPTVPVQITEGGGVAGPSRQIDAAYDLDGMIDEQLSDSQNVSRLQTAGLQVSLGRPSTTSVSPQDQSSSILSSQTRPPRGLSSKDWQRYF